MPCAARAAAEPPAPSLAPSVPPSFPNEAERAILGPAFGDSPRGGGVLRRTPGGRIVHIHIDPTNTVPVYRQIHEGLKTAIVDGRLSAGASLPSTRGLAGDLGVSRSTVVMAYDQ